MRLQILTRFQEEIRNTDILPTAHMGINIADPGFSSPIGVESLS